MIKLLPLRYLGNHRYGLGFSDRQAGVFDLDEYRSCHRGSLLAALDDESLVGCAFLDAGAMCWPHGRELSARRLHELSVMRVAA